MSKLRLLILASIGIALVLSSTVGAAFAGPSDARVAATAATGAQPGLSLVSRPAGALTSGALSLSGLKAVLVVGPVPEDPSYSAFANSIMDQCAAVLTANGVTVHKFYSPNASWTPIKGAADGAHFFLYAGHGLRWDGGSEPQVGGLHLNSGNASPDAIRNELHLAPGAIVMIAACYAAGTGDIEYRSVDIGIGEAQRRVAQYSEPFLDIGAGGYYGDSFGWNNAFELYFTYLFQGKTMGESYMSMGDVNDGTPNTVTYSTHPAYPAMAMWLDKDFDHVWNYNEAFVGYDNRDLQDLFGRRLTVDPSSLAFLAKLKSGPQYQTIHIDLPENVGWTAAFTPSTPAWASASPLSGTGPGSVTVQAKPASVSAAGTYQTGLRIVASDPGIENRTQTVPITLRVVNHLATVYVPLIAD